MTFRLGHLVVLAAQEFEQCQFCPATAECRPYGPEGKAICVECAAKPEYREEVEKRMDQMLGIQQE